MYSVTPLKVLEGSATMVFTLKNLVQFQSVFFKDIVSVSVSIYLKTGTKTAVLRVKNDSEVYQKLLKTKKGAVLAVFEKHCT